MLRTGFRGIVMTSRTLRLVPGRAPAYLERLAVVCMRASTNDSRLGDLSETYVRTHERARMRLGTQPAALVVAHLVADLHYLLAAATVILFARAVDPCRRLAERSPTAFITFDLREGAMTMWRVAAGRLVLPILLLLGSVLLINSAVDVWYTGQQTEALIMRLQREKANATAARIEQFLAGVQSQIGWTTTILWATSPLEQRRVDYLRLLRQVPAITEVADVKADGKEALRVSRLAMDVADSGADFAQDLRFVEARKRRAYFGPVYFRKPSEPYLSLAQAQDGVRRGVTLAEVNLKPVWETVRAVEAGQTGYAYLLDRTGHLIAHRDPRLVVRQPDLSSWPQVAAALTSPGVEPIEGRAVDFTRSGSSVLSVHAVVPTPGWQVFVEVPVGEVRASVWGTLIRGVGLLGLGLAAGLLASLLAARRITLARPAREVATR